MAKLKVGSGYFADFDTVPLATASGDIVVADAHLILIKAEDGDENFIGNFQYNDQGLPTGTIDQYRLIKNGDQIYAITEANIDVIELRETAATGDPQDFLKLIFRANDDLVGANLDDLMGGFDGRDHLAGRDGDDSLRGMKGSDTLEGDAGNDVLRGGKAGDALDGGPGDDWLNGGNARNRLTGGDGDDTFAFLSPANPDKVTDFEWGDRIALDFARLGPSGIFQPGHFHLGAEAENRHQKVLYDSDSGWLLYARKGSATDHPPKFAHIGKGLDHLGADDFLVI